MLQDCIRILLTALNLVNKKSSATRRNNFSSSERVSVYLELAEVYRLTNQNQEENGDRLNEWNRLLKFDCFRNVRIEFGKSFIFGSLFAGIE